MLFPIKDRENLQNLNELVSLKNQVKVDRLQIKLGKQNVQEDMKKIFQPVTKSLENTSEKLTKAMTETSIKNNQAIENLDNKFLEIMNDRGILASYLMSPLSKIINPKNTTQFKLVKDSNSNKVNDLNINKTIPITLYNNLLTFCDTGKKKRIKRRLIENDN